VRRILFACVGNSCRSQMAEGFARALGSDVLEVQSAGTRPARGVHPLAVAVMWERHIDISHQTSKPIDAAFARRADLIVTMGCGEECPAFLGKKVVDWELQDPVGQRAEVFRAVRDEIERRVRLLVEEARASALTITA